jgi:hypothetical protein
MDIPRSEETHCVQWEPLASCSWTLESCSTHKSKECCKTTRRCSSRIQQLVPQATAWGTGSEGMGSEGRWLVEVAAAFGVPLPTGSTLAVAAAWGAFDLGGGPLEAGAVWGT